MAPPTSGLIVGRTSGGGWDWKWLFFSFEGRAHRAHYWAVSAASILFAVMCAIVFVAALDASIDGTARDGSSLSAGAALALLVVYALVVWAQLAVGVKRWHDRDKSGAWMFLAIVPFGSLWILVECGFLPGTDGPNQYGGDPRRAVATGY